jgi:hypothetical protein
LDWQRFFLSKTAIGSIVWRMARRLGRSVAVLCLTSLSAVDAAATLLCRAFAEVDITPEFAFNFATHE